VNALVVNGVGGSEVEERGLLAAQQSRPPSCLAHPVAIHPTPVQRQNPMSLRFIIPVLAVQEGCVRPGGVALQARHRNQLLGVRDVFATCGSEKVPDCTSTPLYASRESAMESTTCSFDLYRSLRLHQLSA
jgi:hypothetical protein